MKHYAIALAVLAALTLTGCAGFGQFLPGGAKMTDLFLEGFIGEPELVTALVNGNDKVVACTIPLNIRGEEDPRMLLLEGELKRFCTLEKNTRVTVNAPVSDADGTIKPRTINPEGVGQ